ncbi:DDE superfamily endonuclease, partial [Rhizoctonia solani AG-3 Rhs1AP]
MAGRAVPKLVKVYELSQKKSELLAKAIKLYAAEMKLPPHTRRGARKICKHVVDENGQITGLQSIQDFNSSKSLLNQTEEDHVVEYLVQAAAQGFPLTHQLLEELVNSIIQKHIPNWEGIGKRWVSRFLARNAHCLSTYWGKPLKQCRAWAVNPNTVRAWFDLIQSLISEHSITPINIWGADETGVTLGAGGVERVIGAIGQKGQYRSSVGSHENVSVMVCIGACGRLIPPFVIFKGKSFMVKWLQNNEINAKLSYSKKGYMTGEISIEWIKHFDVHTWVQAQGGP